MRKGKTGINIDLIFKYCYSKLLNHLVRLDVATGEQNGTFYFKKDGNSSNREEERSRKICSRKEAKRTFKN